MTRCETSRLGAIPCLVSCLPQRMLHGKVKTFNLIFKKMREESTRAVELFCRNTILNLNSPKGMSDLKIIDCFSIASCCIDFLKHKGRVRNKQLETVLNFSIFVINILRCFLLDNGHGKPVISFKGFSLAVYCIFVICHKKLSMPRMTL